MEFELDCLIPGVPNDLALQCLVRIPRTNHGYLRCVNSVWRCFLGSKMFHRQRKCLGFVDESLFIVRELHSKVGGNGLEPTAQCFELDLKSQKTSKVLASWGREMAQGIFLRGQACVQMQEAVLFVGGCDRYDSSSPTSQVYKFCTLKKEMVKGKSMLSGRAGFAWAVKGDRLYVAGGRIAAQEWTDKAEMYDSVADEWLPIADMPKRIRVHSYFPQGNRLFVRGFDEERIAQVVCSYGFESNEWREETDMMGENRCCVIVSTEDETLVCAALETYITAFGEDCLSTSLRIRKLVGKSMEHGEEGIGEKWKWETLEVMDKVCSMSVFSMHGRGKQAIVVLPYDLSSMSNWNIFGYPKRGSSNTSGASAERKDAIVSKRSSNDLIEVCVHSCYCYNCCFTSALVIM